MSDLNYVAVCPECGHLTAFMAACFLKDHIKEAAHDIASWGARGDSIERWDSEKVKAGPWGCQPPCSRASKRKWKQVSLVENKP